MSSSYLMVVPCIDREVTAGFVDGLKLPHENVLFVNNGNPEVVPAGINQFFSGGNIGVAASWNLGAKAVLGSGIDWLVIASAAVRWGAPGGQDFIDGLEGCSIAVTSELGWHLLAIHHETLDAVGLFDENFFPGYFEETDWLYRMHLAGLPSPRENGRHWDHAHCDAEYGESSHALNRVPRLAIETQMNALGYYYQRKWAAKPGYEVYTTPFGLDNYPIWKWPAAENHN